MTIGDVILETKWLKIIELKPKPKTRCLSVFSKCSNTEIGVIEWYPGWRAYCFLPTVEFGIVLSDRCQLTLGNFTLELNKTHQELRKEARCKTENKCEQNECD